MSPKILGCGLSNLNLFYYTKVITLALYYITVYS
nr:MAG TPA: hypothetical protein [Caudoviricetes sp.]